MKQRHAWMLCALLALAGCASTGGRLVQPGPNPAGGQLTIDSEMEWTRASTDRFQLWTIDGELLNTLYLVPVVREREYIFLGHRETRRRQGAFVMMRLSKSRALASDIGIFLVAALSVVVAVLAR